MTNQNRIAKFYYKPSKRHHELLIAATPTGIYAFLDRKRFRYLSDKLRAILVMRVCGCVYSHMRGRRRASRGTLLGHGGEFRTASACLRRRGRVSESTLACRRVRVRASCCHNLAADRRRVRQAAATLYTNARPSASPFPRLRLIEKRFIGGNSFFASRQ